MRRRPDWYKRFPDKWLAGVAPLTLEERGAYDTVIDVLYSRDDGIIPDDYSMSRHCNCDPRTWRRVRDNLVRKGKLYIGLGGKLTARRVEDELKIRRRQLEDLPKSNGFHSNINDRRPKLVVADIDTDSEEDSESLGKSRVS